MVYGSGYTIRVYPRKTVKRRPPLATWRRHGTAYHRGEEGASKKISGDAVHRCDNTSNLGDAHWPYTPSCAKRSFHNGSISTHSN
mmetsp:Transcript_33258/g.87947  ORF Transcript_33258/g.87947 Transcript_33258/m.87947 type:complete len:85 (-) Transcript_33258:401-655(-)